MIEKRYSYNIYKEGIECDGNFVAYVNIVDGARIVNELNELVEENELLKKENKELKEENKELLFDEYRPYSIKRAKKPYATIKELQRND